MLTSQSSPACKPDFHRLYTNQRLLYSLRLASDKCASTTGDCSGRARGLRQAGFEDCLPVTRRRFGCGVPESDVVGVGAPELLLLGETALVTHAGDALLFFNLEK